MPATRWLTTPEALAAERALVPLRASLLLARVVPCVVAKNSISYSRLCFDFLRSRVDRQQETHTFPVPRYVTRRFVAGAAFTQVRGEPLFKVRL